VIIIIIIIIIITVVSSSSNFPHLICFYSYVSEYHLSGGTEEYHDNSRFIAKQDFTNIKQKSLPVGSHDVEID
jgi:hypothetical protein